MPLDSLPWQDRVRLTVEAPEVRSALASTATFDGRALTDDEVQEVSRLPATWFEMAIEEALDTAISARLRDRTA